MGVHATRFCGLQRIHRTCCVELLHPQWISHTLVSDLSCLHVILLRTRYPAATLSSVSYLSCLHVGIQPILPIAQVRARVSSTDLQAMRRLQLLLEHTRPRPAEALQAVRSFVARADETDPAASTGCQNPACTAPQSSRGLKKCGRCGVPRYCSTGSCQVAHWRAHKKECVPAVRQPPGVASAAAASSARRTDAQPGDVAEGLTPQHLRTLVRGLLAQRMAGLRHVMVCAQGPLQLYTLWVDMRVAPAAVEVVKLGTAQRRLAERVQGRSCDAPIPFCDYIAGVPFSGAWDTGAEAVSEELSSRHMVASCQLAASCALGSVAADITCGVFEYLPAVVLVWVRALWCPDALALGPFAQERVHLQTLREFAQDEYLQRLKEEADRVPSIEASST